MFVPSRTDAEPISCWAYPTMPCSYAGVKARIRSVFLNLGAGVGIPSIMWRCDSVRVPWVCKSLLLWMLAGVVRSMSLTCLRLMSALVQSL